MLSPVSKGLLGADESSGCTKRDADGCEGVVVRADTWPTPEGPGCDWLLGEGLPCDWSVFSFESKLLDCKSCEKENKNRIIHC